MTLYLQSFDSSLTDSARLAAFCQSLPKDFAISKYGVSEVARQMDTFNAFDDPAWQSWIKKNPSSLTLRMKAMILDFRKPSDGFGASILLRPTARDLAKQVAAMDLAWESAIPDAQGFTYCYSGYTSHVQDPSIGQPDSEYVNRFGFELKYPVYHARTGEYLYDASEDMPVLGPGKLDLLPGLTWRIAMGERLFEKYNISPEEISKVCVATKVTKAANGERLWKFQSREDPFAWRESYERQLKLDRPDVFFDVAPLRKRFAEPIEITDNGQGEALAKMFHAALTEIYPPSATRDIPR